MCYTDLLKTKPHYFAILEGWATFNDCFLPIHEYIEKQNVEEFGFFIAEAKSMTVHNMLERFGKNLLLKTIFRTDEKMA